MESNKDKLKDEFVPNVSEIYGLLMKDALGIAQTLAESLNHFLYFCLSLIVFCIVFASIGFYFLSMLGNLQVAASFWIMALIVAMYALILWKDYSKMHKRFSQLFATKKRIEEELKKSGKV